MTNPIWGVRKERILEDWEVSLVADHGRTLTSPRSSLRAVQDEFSSTVAEAYDLAMSEGFDTELADAGNSLLRHVSSTCSRK